MNAQLWHFLCRNTYLPKSQCISSLLYNVQLLTKNIAQMAQKFSKYNMTHLVKCSGIHSAKGNRSLSNFLYSSALLELIHNDSTGDGFFLQHEINLDVFKVIRQCVINYSFFVMKTICFIIQANLRYTMLLSQQQLFQVATRVQKISNIIHLFSRG